MHLDKAVQAKRMGVGGGGVLGYSSIVMCWIFDRLTLMTVGNTNMLGALRNQNSRDILFFPQAIAV